VRARSYNVYACMNRTAVGQIRNIGYDHIANSQVGTLSSVLNVIIAVRVKIKIVVYLGLRESEYIKIITLTYKSREYFCGIRGGCLNNEEFRDVQYNIPT